MRRMKLSEAVMVIYMDQYRKAKATSIAMRHRRDEERMCVNSSPAVAMSATFCCRHPHAFSPQLPDDLAGIDIEAFVDRVYGLASQI